MISKNPLLVLSGVCLVTVLDVCMGGLIGITVAHFLFFDYWDLAATGAICALLPDFDLVYTIMYRKAIGTNHKTTLFHRPLPMLALLIPYAWWAHDMIHALVAGLGLMWHYCHDTDAGIAFLWPFFPDKYVQKRGWRFEIVSLEETKGHAFEGMFYWWLENTWLCPSTKARQELTTALIACLIASVITGRSWLLMPPALFTFGASMLWIVARKKQRQAAA